MWGSCAEGLYLEAFLCLQANVRNYYMQFEETQTQDEIDIKIREFEERSKGAFAAQVGVSKTLP